MASDAIILTGNASEIFLIGRIWHIRGWYGHHAEGNMGSGYLILKIPNLVLLTQSL